MLYMRDTPQIQRYKQVEHKYGKIYAINRNEKRGGTTIITSDKTDIMTKVIKHKEDILKMVFFKFSPPGIHINCKQICTNKSPEIHEAKTGRFDKGNTKF